MYEKLPLMVPFVLYLLVLIAVSVYTFRFTKTMEGFHLGGRSRYQPYLFRLQRLDIHRYGWALLCGGPCVVVYARWQSFFYADGVFAGR